MKHRDPQQAFKDAINNGYFNDWDDLAENWVGNFMYMGTTEDDRDAFKNCDTRAYVYVPIF
ncbi:MAG: hypothetical protein KGL39_55755 [Patescibacteria group bacterium]|nr:hypothetical protein [Patescibacteria group bacterium]